MLTNSRSRRQVDVAIVVVDKSVVVSYVVDCVVEMHAFNAEM